MSNRKLASYTSCITLDELLGYVKEDIIKIHGKDIGFIDAYHKRIGNAKKFRNDKEKMYSWFNSVYFLWGQGRASFRTTGNDNNGYITIFSIDIGTPGFIYDNKWEYNLTYQLEMDGTFKSCIERIIKKSNELN